MRWLRDFELRNGYADSAILFRLRPIECAVTVTPFQRLACRFPRSAASVQPPDRDIEDDPEGDPCGDGDEGERREAVERPESGDGRDNQQPSRNDVDQGHQRAVRAKEQERPQHVERELDEEEPNCQPPARCLRGSAGNSPKRRTS